jgi:uncharacterized oligopeptide transporter (OPT) family protein
MLMRLVIDGVLDQSLPWALVAIGVAIGLIVAALKLPVLPFAVGVYLPLETMAAVFLGGLLRWFLTRARPVEEAERRREEGVLFGAGLVGGGGLTGVLLAAWVGLRGGEPIRGIPVAWSEPVQQVVALAGIAAIMALLSWHVRRATRQEPAATP